MKTNLEIVREKVIEAVPEIMELKFGCRFGFKNGIQTCVALNSSEWKRLDFYYSHVGDIPPTYANLHRKDILDDIEILGRPIQLADVLRALPDSIDGKIFHIEFDGTIYSRSPQTGMIECEAYWNLRKPLDGQSPETLQFLAEILK